MGNLISEVDESYEKKIAALQKQIDILRAKKTLIISSLQEDIGDQEIKSLLPSQEKTMVSKEPTQQNRSVTIRDRLLRALNRMPLSEFKTPDLFIAVNTDENGGEINKNRAFKILKDLIDEDYVRIIKPRSGKTGGIYQRVIQENELSYPDKEK